MPTAATWPWPGDTATDRARRIANTLLTLLPPNERDTWATRAHALGETWLGAALLRWTNDDILTTTEAAELIHVSPSTIRKWHSEGERGLAPRLPAHGRGRYRAGDVLDCAAARRRRRQTRATA